MIEQPVIGTGHTLYRLFNAEGDLLYIGHTGDLTVRLRCHKSDKAWWSEVSRIESVEHWPKEAAIEAERAAIRSESPRYNVQLMPGARMVVVNFRVPETVKEAALERCEREEINLSDALRDFLIEWSAGD